MPTGIEEKSGQQGRVIAGQGGRFVAGPVAAADVQGQTLARKAFERSGQERAGELELLGPRPFLAQGAAHERAVAAGSDDHERPR